MPYSGAVIKAFRIIYSSKEQRALLALGINGDWSIFDDRSNINYVCSYTRNEIKGLR